VIQQKGISTNSLQRHIQLTPEDDLSAELRPLPGATAPDLSEEERRRRFDLASSRRERLVSIMESLSPAEAQAFLERFSSRHRDDELSQRFHDLLSTSVREELMEVLRRRSTTPDRGEPVTPQVYQSPRYIDNMAESVGMELMSDVYRIHFTRESTAYHLRIPNDRLARTTVEPIVTLNEIHPTLEAAQSSLFSAPIPSDFPIGGVYAFYEHNGMILPTQFTPASIPRIYDGIVRKDQQMREAADDAESALWGVALGLGLRLLFSAFSSISGGSGSRTPAPTEESGVGGSTLASRARAMVSHLREAGHDVIVNLGGTGASHEPTDAINVNPNLVARRRVIPNHIEAAAEDIGGIFEHGSVDRVIGRGLPHDVLEWDRVASGARSILRPGGRVDISLRWANEMEMNRMVAAFRAAGFEDVIPIGNAWLRAIQP
jgi:hypothetical protein